MLMSRRYGLRTVVLLAPPGCRPSMETAGRESAGWAAPAGHWLAVIPQPLLGRVLGSLRRTTSAPMRVPPQQYVAVGHRGHVAACSGPVSYRREFGASRTALHGGRIGFHAQ